MEKEQKMVREEEKVQEGLMKEEGMVKEESKKKQEEYENDQSNSQQQEKVVQKQLNDDSSRKKSEMVDEDNMEDERDFLQMDEFYKKNIFLTDKKMENINSKQDVEQLSPKEYSFAWLDQGGNGSQFQMYSYDLIDMTDMKALDLNVEVNRLYMVKWKNLSYTQATWEL